MAALFLSLCWLIASTTCIAGTESTSSAGCVSIGILSRSGLTVTAKEGSNVTFWCYKKTNTRYCTVSDNSTCSNISTVSNTSAVWKLRTTDHEYIDEIEKITTERPGIVFEPDVDPEVGSDCHTYSVNTQECEDGNGNMFQYHCFRLTLLAVNVSLNNSLVSCGYSISFTYLNGINGTEELYHDPFLLRVESQTMTPNPPADNDSCTCNKSDGTASPVADVCPQKILLLDEAQATTATLVVVLVDNVVILLIIGCICCYQLSKRSCFRKCSRYCSKKCTRRKKDKNKIKPDDAALTTVQSETADLTLVHPKPTPPLNPKSMPVVLPKPSPPPKFDKTPLPSIKSTQ